MIKSTLNHKGKTYQLEYTDCDSFDHLPYNQCKQVYGVCFCEDKMVITHSKGSTSWNLVGGHIEVNERFEETLKREVVEEANMKVIKCAPIGVQKVIFPDGKTIEYQLRYCALVEKISEFENDPAGNVFEIKLIDPKDYKQYFDWGEIGERIINRAIELKKLLN